MKKAILIFLFLFLVTAFGQKINGTSQKALILHDFKHGPIPNPEYGSSNKTYLDSLSFARITIFLRPNDFSVNVSGNCMSSNPMSYQIIANALAPIKDIPFNHLKQNYVLVFGNSPGDVFDDWSVPIQNFANLAKAIKNAGLSGIYFDNEEYSRHWTNYPDACLYKNKTLQEYQDQVWLRGKELMEAMVSQFPQIKFIVLHGPYISEPLAPSPLFPQWQTHNELKGPFFAGLLEGTGSTAVFIDGGELYNYRITQEFRRFV